MEVEMEKEAEAKKEADENDIMDIFESMNSWEEEQEQKMRQFAEEQGIEDFDEDIINELGNVRRPLVLVRGEPITAEQTMELITGEEPLFREGIKEEETEFSRYFDPRSDRGVLKNLFYRQGYSWLSTWVYSDGTIGGDLIFLGKYPEWDEMILPYMHLADKYPFLNLVISYTTYDECCCYFCMDDGVPDKACMEACKCKDCEPYLDKLAFYSYKNRGYYRNADLEEKYFRNWDTSHVRSDVGDSVVLTIWIHGGKTEILFGKKAADKFTEYDHLYCVPEYAYMFSSDLYDSEENCICSKAFVEDCFAYIGKPRSLCDEYVEKGFISPFNEDAVVVTKEWMIQQYRTFISHSLPVENIQ